MRDTIADAASGESSIPGALFCAVLDCTPADLLLHEPQQVKARRDELKRAASGGPSSRGGTPVAPRLGRNRSLPPA